MKKSALFCQPFINIYLICQNLIGALLHSVFCSHPLVLSWVYQQTNPISSRKNYFVRFFRFKSFFFIVNYCFPQYHAHSSSMWDNSLHFVWSTVYSWCSGSGHQNFGEIATWGKKIPLLALFVVSSVFGHIFEAQLTNVIGIKPICVWHLTQSNEAIRLTLLYLMNPRLF